VSSVVYVFNLGILGNLAHLRHLNFLWLDFDGTFIKRKEIKNEEV
jgi:hypothetical protein